MKSLVFALLFIGLSTPALRAQEAERTPPPPQVPYNAATQTIAYAQEIEMPGLTAAQIVQVAKNFYVSNFNGAAKELEVDAQGAQVQSTAVRLRVMGFDLVRYEYNVSAKDGHAKLTLTPLSWESYRPPAGPNTRPVFESDGLKMTDAQLRASQDPQTRVVPFPKIKGLLGKMTAGTVKLQYEALDKTFAQKLADEAKALGAAAKQAQKNSEF